MLLSFLVALLSNPSIYMDTESGEIKVDFFNMRYNFISSSR